jgi:hypothetical protein
MILIQRLVDDFERLLSSSNQSESSGVGLGASLE